MIVHTVRCSDVDRALKPNQQVFWVYLQIETPVVVNFTWKVGMGKKQSNDIGNLNLQDHVLIAMNSALEVNSFTYIPTTNSNPKPISKAYSTMFGSFEDEGVLLSTDVPETSSSTTSITTSTIPLPPPVVEVAAASPPPLTPFGRFGFSCW